MSGLDEVISVAELDRRLKRVVEGASADLWVEGEVASLKVAPSGHTYFTLKDEREEAIIECVMYRFDAQRSRRIMKDGARIQLRGRATLWAPRGRLQFVGSLARLAGRGALLEALEKLKQKLEAEGLFEPSRKRPLPADPRIIGVVTSGAGAAFHDIRTVAFRRGSLKIVLSPALVQGEGAALSIVRALDLLERYPGLDALIVGRGGGSGEDLLAFSEERVVRRIAATRVPVVSAVGHETDITLADLVADARAATPSQAAELLVPDIAARAALLGRLQRQLASLELTVLARARTRLDRVSGKLADPRFVIAERQQELDDLRARLADAERLRAVRQRRRIFELSERLAHRHPQRVLVHAQAEVARLSTRLSSTVVAALARRRERLAVAVAELSALSPLAVLARGYSIVTREGGRAVRSSQEISLQDTVEVRLSRGRFHARVVAVEAEVEEGN